MTWALVQDARASGYAGLSLSPVWEPVSLQSSPSMTTWRLCNRSRQPS